MVIDIPHHPEHARLYDCLDLDTGEPLDVFYADDAAGVYRIFRRDGAGHFFLDPATGDIAMEERRGRIRIINAEDSPRGRGPATQRG